jgi:diaminopimelate epimerase
VAASLVGDDGAVLMTSRWSAWNGQPFVKMSGSGNDFVVFDTISTPIPSEISHELIAAICNRRNGIGADGVVVLGSGASVSASVSYFNADGSRGELCGNATLCSTALCVSLGYANASSVKLLTDSGLVEGTVDEEPSIRLQPVSELASEWAPGDRRPDERRIGFARVGVPHLVVLVDDVSTVDVDRRGRALRHDPTLGPAGANANFVSEGQAGLWRMRTFERGVEAETLACGTGAVATAAMLARWGLADPGRPAQLETRSGRSLTVSVEGDSAGRRVPRLRGEGRIVFSGRIGELLD